MKITIAIIGAGSVGSFLATELFNSGCHISQIYNRTYARAVELSDKVNAQAISDLKQVKSENDIIILALPDKLIPESCELISQMPSLDSVVVASVSGSVRLDEISQTRKKIGVMYPLQSFTQRTKPENSTIPFCLEANDAETLLLLEKVARKISKDIRYINSDKRLVLHLAAVFACNFTNHMVTIAEELLKDVEIEPKILYPLINETVNRIEIHRAVKMQTGPAIREDIATLEKHLLFLKSNADNSRVSEIYKLISESIIQMHRNK